MDDILISALDLPVLMLIFSSGIFVLDNYFHFTDTELLSFIDVGFKAVTIIAIIMFFDKLFKGFVEFYSSRMPVLKDSKGVLNVVVRILVLGLGTLILLDNFGVSITPLLASLGIGSLAVALALQPTLENFFSGLQMVIDKPVGVGHFIQLESGEKGYVEKIGWRSTWIRLLPDNIVIIPNKIMVNSRIVNFYYPRCEMGLKVQVGVHYDSDLDKVERVTIETAKDVLEKEEGGITDFEPFIRFHTFNDSSIDFVVILRVREAVDAYRVKHEFIKALKKRFDKEGIVIPYPIRTLDWNKGSDPVKLENK